MAIIKREEIICDICGKETSLDNSLYFIGREMDAAGNMDDVGYHIDLCPPHYADAFREACQIQGRSTNDMPSLKTIKHLMSYSQCKKLSQQLDVMKRLWLKMSQEERDLMNAIHAL